MPSSPIRIAFCIDNMQIGGTELNAIRTAERLDPERVELRVICLQDHGPLLERYAAAGIPVHVLPLGSMYGRAALARGRELIALLRQHRVQLLHAHDVYSNVFAVPFARLAGVKTIASRRWWEGMPGLHWRLASFAAYRLASRTLVNAPRVGEWVSEVERLDPARISVVCNFVDEAAFEVPVSGWREQMLRELGADPERPTVGIIANLLPIKDHASLLQAVKLVRARGTHLQLVLIGDGEERPRLEELARALGIGDSVFFAGRRPNSPNHHAAFDISVLCSRSEGLSNSVLEAMAAGRPVVATDVGATADAVVHGETGLLVPPGDVVALAAALHRLACDPPYARHLGDAGRRRARAHFSPEAALPRLEQLYAELVAPVHTRATVAAAEPLSRARS